jgi:hypothetical protein
VPNPLATAQILTLLEAAPPRLAAATKGVASAQLHTPPHRDDWSANEVLAHMRSCADVWGDCMVAILQGTPTLRAMNPRTWIKQTDYPEQDFQRSLRAFARQRAKLLTVLKPLTPEEWSRKATVTGAGKPLERTVLSYAQWLAEHERPHVKQIERIVSAMRT